jgi:hypothetical protein
MPISLTNVFDIEHPGYVSGRYYQGLELVSADSAGSNGLAINAISYYPFRVHHSISINRLAILCPSGISGADATIGIYSNSNGLPKDLIISSGTLIASSAGVKEGVVSANLNKDWYWFGGITSKAPALYCATTFLGTNHILGQTSPSVASGSCSLRNIAGSSYASLPAIAPVDNLSLIAGQFAPFFWFRVT